MESKYTIDNHKTKRYYNCIGQLHREDGPAVEYTKFPYFIGWFLHGREYNILNEMPLSLFLVYIKYHLRDIIKS